MQRTGAFWHEKLGKKRMREKLVSGSEDWGRVEVLPTDTLFANIYVLYLWIPHIEHCYSGGSKFQAMLFPNSP